MMRRSPQFSPRGNFSGLHTLRIFKTEKSVRVGISFERDEDRTQGMIGAAVKSLHPSGLAVAAGLMAGDVVCSINGLEIYDSLGAAAVLRDSEGEILISMQRVQAAPSPREQRLTASAPTPAVKEPVVARALASQPPGVASQRPPIAVGPPAAAEAGARGEERWRGGGEWVVRYWEAEGGWTSSKAAPLPLHPSPTGPSARTLPDSPTHPTPLPPLDSLPLA